MKATFDQSVHMLTLAKQQPHFSLEWLQDLYDSGILSDVLSVPEPKKLDRNAVRKALGHGPLTPPFLEPIGVVTIAAAPKFVARERFVRDTSNSARVKITYLGDNFKGWFLEKIEEPRSETTLDCAKLTRSALDKEIRKEIGVEFEETTLAQIYALMERQLNGEEGVLLTNGWANIFYVKDVNGILRAVSVGWDARDGGWRVGADSVTYPRGWDGSHRVFSRNSSVAVTV